ncbi:hypothetical protein K6V34_11100, partial [Streptococcus suis]|nr:hypothetical protein [Streptococcus suis]
KKIVQDNRDKRKTQTVRLNFIKISLNLSVFFIYWLVFAQPLFYCDLVSSSYVPLGPHRWKVEITVSMHPFRYVKNPADVVLTSSGSVQNPGTVYSEPIIIIEGSGRVTLTIGQQVIELDLDTRATVDCRHKRQNIYDKNGAVKNTIRKRGPFFEIPVGRSGISTSGTVSKITIKGNWRYKV